MPGKTAQQQIHSLEGFIAAGDIQGMARVITDLHEDWDGISEAEQRDILRLEAIFLSLVKMHVEGNA